MKGRIAFACLTLLFSSLALLAQSGPDNEPAAAPGYVNNVFHVSSVDSINAFNGQLTIPIAVGPSYPVGPKLKFQAMLTYNSRVWEYGNPSVFSGGEFPYKPLVGNPVLGIGCNFTLGRIGRTASQCGIGTLLCYFGSDGSQVDFVQEGSSLYWSTHDASQLRLFAQNGYTSGPYIMWDEDGNQYSFTTPVAGYDDVLQQGDGYIYDYGRGRDGWYLTSLTDPFGNQISVEYQTSSGACQGFCMRVCSAPTPWIPQYIKTQAVGGSLQTVAEVVLAGNLIGSFKFHRSGPDMIWTLAYQPGTVSPGRPVCPNPGVQLLTTIQLPPDVAGTNGYQFEYNPLGLVKRMVLPTNGEVQYRYGNYNFYHGQAAALPSGDCSLEPPPAADVLRSTIDDGLAGSTQSPRFAQPSGDCPYVQAYAQFHLGVLRRTVTGQGLADAPTDYTQYAFPYGERNFGVMYSQTLTVTLFPPEVGGARRAEARLFWGGPEQSGDTATQGDRTGAELRHAVYESDPNPAIGISIQAPICGNNADSLCVTHSVRVMQNNYDYDTAGATGPNRRLQSETTYYTATQADDTCSMCPYHAVAFSLNSSCGLSRNQPCTWQGNGRHYNVETHSGNLGSVGSDSRSITTTWTPANWAIPPFGTVMPNLYEKRIESDSTLTMNRYFEFDGSNGFLNCSFLWDSDPSRQRVFLGRRYPNGDGTVYQDFTASATPFPSPPYIGQCTASYPNAPYPSGAAMGTNGDAFGKIYTYQNGLLKTVRWINGNTPASWYAKNYTRDSGTGWITASSDTAGKTTNYQYDSIGRVTLIAPPDGEASIVVGYPLTTRITATRNDVTGLSTYQQYEYDGLGRLSRDIHQMPGINRYAVRTHAYDGPGRQYFNSEWATCTTVTGDCMTAAPVGTTNSSFDPFGRPQTTTRADRSTTDISYASAVSVHSDTDKTVTIYNLGGTCSGGTCSGGSSAQTIHISDAFGRFTSVTEPENAVTSYTYDVNAKLTRVTQPGLADRTFTYDPAGFLRQETTPEKGTVSYSYGSIGNILTESPSGVNLTRSYDFAGRLLTLTSDEQSPSRTYLSNVYNDSIADNSLGKLTSRSASNYPSPGTYSVSDTYVYNGLGGRLSSQTTAVGGGPNPSTTQSWFYNGLGLPAHHYHARAFGQAPFVVSYDYDAGLPVQEYANGIPVVTAVTYQPSGTLASYTTGVGIGHNVTTTIGPDTSLLPRPSSITTTGAPVNFVSGSYSYDGAGNIMVIGADNFAYDPRSRLCRANLSGAGSQFYTYDQYGNLITKAFTDPGTCVASTSWANNRLPGNIATYDGRGNVTANLIAPGGAENYTLDGLDRLITHQGPTLTWDYLYDGGSERIAKVLRSGAWTYTFRDEGKRVSSEFGGSAPSRDNIFLGNLLAVSYASIPGSDKVWTFYSSDHLGTPRLITDLNGTTLEAPRKWPFGEDAVTAYTAQRIRFASMERDTEASRYHDHARGHEFNLGRFLSPDQIGGKAGDPQSWNRYAYARNNPLKNVDPNGLEEMTFTFRAFIQQPSVLSPYGLFSGDSRGFSLAPKASFRTQQVIRVETDPAKSGNHPMLSRPQQLVGRTTNLTTGQSAYAKGNSGGDSMSITATRDANQNVVIQESQNVHNPLAPGAPGITSSVTITVDPSGNNILSTESVGNSPSFEANVLTESGTSFSLFRSSEVGSSLFFGIGLYSQSSSTASCTNVNSNPQCQQTPAPR